MNWNKHEILHLVRFRTNNNNSTSSTSTLTCSWIVRTGETLRLVVRPDRTSERERYTLQIDGQDFARFPTIRELERDERQYYSTISSSSTTPQEVVLRLVVPDDDAEEEDVGQRSTTTTDNNPAAADVVVVSSSKDNSKHHTTTTNNLSSEQDMRLSMAGFCHHHHHHHPTNNIAFTCGEYYDDYYDNTLLRDELHSDLYSPALDALRTTITTALPAAEPFLSRAIAHAFCAETGSMTSSCDSLSVYSLEGGCPSALEASVLKGALEWTTRRGRRRNNTTNNDDNNDNNNGEDNIDDERRLQFLQKLIDELLMHFRNENIDAEETAKIVLGAAVVLGLTLDQEIPQDTVLVCVSPTNHWSEQDMIHHLQQRYGDIRTAAIAPFSGVGFARFLRAVDAHRAARDDDGDGDLQLFLVAPSTDFCSKKKKNNFFDDKPRPLFRHRRRCSSTTTLDSTDHTTTSAGSEDDTAA